ncbi:hypothetical protein LTR08_007121 [Meristemomyces frigidus]|nr:hypothetical protein LTR08_007121 [Meristemomyces frigidus]
MAPSSSAKHDLEISDNDMASSIQKTRRSKKPKATSSLKSIITATRTESSHPYLDSSEVCAIKHWNDSIPTKSIQAPAVPGDVDPVIQAYMQAKMALFTNHPVQPRKSN